MSPKSLLYAFMLHFAVIFVLSVISPIYRLTLEYSVANLRELRGTAPPLRFVTTKLFLVLTTACAVNSCLEREEYTLPR